MRKRVTAPLLGNVHLKANEAEFSTSIHENHPVQPIMKEVIDRCEIKELDPSSCIPLHLFRGRSNNAVQKLKSIFKGKLNSSELSLPGLVSGTTTSVVVPLVSNLEYLIRESILREGHSEADVGEIKSRHDVWYGIIDGNQFHSAIMELREENPTKWDSYRWLVTIVLPEKDLGAYRKLARIQNERNKALYHYESTIFDLLNGLRMEYDLLYNRALKKAEQEDEVLKSTIRK